MEKQSTSKSLSHLPITDIEKEVCKTLLNLSVLIENFDYSNGLPVWGAKKRRSAIDLLPMPKKKRKIKSPVTPLTFPVSEDLRRKSREKVTKKKAREELLETLKELAQTKELLTNELEKVKSLHNMRKAYNALLKAKQQELQLKGREPSKRLNLGTELSLNITPFPLSTENHQTYNPHFLTLIQQQQSSPILQYPLNQTPPLSSTLVSASVNHMGPLGLPDLNMVFDAESLDRRLHNLGYDNKKAKAAEARKRRKAKLREMKLNSALFKTSKC